MSLFDKIKNAGKYKVWIICNNCKYKSQLLVKKGIKISNFISSVDCKCKACGCQIQSKRMKDGSKVWEYQTEWEK